MRLSILHEASPAHPIEDACLALCDGSRALLLAVDGAAQRLTTSATDALCAGQSGAAFAAALTRTVVASDPWADPAALLLRANDALRAALESVYGTLTAEAIAAREPQIAAAWADDPRRVRLALPVCVATLAQIDLRAGTIRWAHAGDTALYLFAHDGTVIEATTDQMGPHDRAALALALHRQAMCGAPHLADVLADPAVLEANRTNGLYHNYVGPDGAPDPAGVGVINGLPELAHYIETGTTSLEEIGAALVCTDGFPWPAAWDEDDSGRAERLRAMRGRIRRDGLRGYYDALMAAQAADATRDQFPRFGIHDDTTAVLCEVYG